MTSSTCSQKGFSKGGCNMLYRTNVDLHSMYLQGNQLAADSASLPGGVKKTNNSNKDTKIGSVHRCTYVLMQKIGT